VFLFGVFLALIADPPILSSGRCCEPPGVARMVVFGGDPFVDLVRNQTMFVMRLSIQLVISNQVEYS
jgi:hypothetical protein